MVSSGGNEQPDERHSSTGAIVGGVIGGVAAVAIFITCFIFYRRHQQRKTVSEYNQSTGYIRNQEYLSPPRYGSSTGFTTSDAGLSSPEPRSMSQVSRNQDHSDTEPIPFRLPDSSASSTVRNTASKNRVSNLTHVSRSATISMPYRENRTVRRNNAGEEDLREEVNNLRMEIERIREETAPPSYQT